MSRLVLSRRAEWIVRLIIFFVALYCFLGAIEMFGHAMKIVGVAAAKDLFSGLENPFAGLAVGVLATAMVQSSSVTTSIVVAAVGSGTLPVENAIPIVMGANVGTSITNMLVAVGYITQHASFRRAFAGATVHDIFNILTVIILLPLELTTHFLERSATFLQQWVEFLITQVLGGGGTFSSPIKASVKWLPNTYDSILKNWFGLEGNWLVAVLIVTALAMILVALVVITRNMRLLMADRIEEWINRVLKKSGLLGLAIGTGTTALVQSSSITTSLLVPMFGAGVLTIEAGFPIMLGANIGTTVTAILASTVAIGPAGLTIALVHLLFNLSGTLIFFPFRPIRRIPIRLSEKLAELTVKNRIWVLIYILGTFIVAPLLGILIWRS
ncbi:MAG: Na/Pi symporter [Pirellulales bacterium]|nr:Na/Pi symporter [Pirellulales bacterium]